jgi:L-threonylcarbamoyladenylate synthase
MKYKHYSPKARVVLYESTFGGDGDGGVTRADVEAAQQAVVNGTLSSTAGETRSRRIGLIRTQRWKPSAGFHSGSPAQNGVGHCDEEPSNIVARQLLDADGRAVGELLDIDLGKDPRSIAQGLFSALRALDRRGADVIFVDGIDDEIDIAAAVMNRLRKAASDIRA